MSTTDNAFSATLDPIDTPKATLKQRWWHVMDNMKVGIIPLPLFLLAGGLIALDCLGGKLPSDIVVMVATLAFFGFACGEFGKRLPILGKLGAAAICATFIPSALVIVSTVSALVATGFLVGKKIGMHPIDVAIVSCCQSGQGGTGDVAILTSGNRMSLMPFAQIATRIGGAINVSLGLLFLSHFLA